MSTIIQRIKAMVLRDFQKPKAGTTFSAGLDLRLSRDICIRPGTVEKDNLGIKVEIPKGYCGLIVPRSSVGSVLISLANTIGVIDSDYRGELIVKLHNQGRETQFLAKGQRVVQLIVVPHLDPNEIIYVKELSDTERGDKGFGHTGKS